MNRAVAVIQARLGSQRFPGKMLADLGGRPVLEWVVRRVQSSRLVDRIIVATTLEPLDDRLVEECQRLGVEAFRGSTNDVLRRFVDAIEGDPATEVVRICADNPFIDPECIDEVIREYRSSEAQYAFNHRPAAACNYADGFGAEVISVKLLRKLDKSATSSTHREHVTLAVADGTVAAVVHACTTVGMLARPDLRFDVDTPDDLDHLALLVRHGGLGIGSSAADIVAASKVTTRSSS